MAGVSGTSGVMAASQLFPCFRICDGAGALLFEHAAFYKKHFNGEARKRNSKNNH